MNDRIKFCRLALSVLLGLGFSAGGIPSVHASEGLNPASIGVAQSSGVLRATLDNGLRVVIVHDSMAPTVTTQITYLTGGYETPKGYPGTAHALEHMMFRDSEGMTGDQLNEMTGKMGARNNAFTTNDATSFFFSAPAQYLDILLHIESVRMRGAKLTDKGWGLEKGAIEQEVSRDISAPEQLASMQAQRIMYAGTGYAEDALGTRPSFDKTTGAILQRFYNRWYRPNNAVLVIVGDVQPQATLAKVRTLFGPIAKGKLPTRVPVDLQPFKNQTITKSTSNDTGSVQYVYRAPGQRSKDYAALQVLLDVLGNPRSRLSELAAHGKVLSTGVDIGPFMHGGMLSIEADFPKGGDHKQAQQYLDGVISDMLKHGVSADLVEAAKRRERMDFESKRTSAPALAMAWSQAVAWQGLDSPEQALDQIEAVTPQDVDRVAREYLKPDQRITIVLTPGGKGQRPPESHGFGGTEQFAGNDKLDAPLPEWAAKPLANLQMPHWTLNPVKMVLSNGITLIVQPETISKTVYMFGKVDHSDDLQEPKGQEGVGKLLQSLFSYGTTTLDRDAFNQALDGIAANEGAGTQFGLKVASEHFDRGVQLLADNELHPALPQSAFAVQQKKMVRTLIGQMQTPEYKLHRAMNKQLLPAGDPQLREATPDTVRGLTLADVKGYFGQVYRPDMTTIVVVGDVTPDQAKAVVEKYFGTWKAVGPKPDVIPEPVPLNPPGYSAVRDPFASQDNVVWVQNMAINLHNPDRYALELGNDVLGGNGFSSRLMVDVRVRHGYAYGAGSGMRFGRSRSLFMLGYGSDPDKVKPVDALVRKNLDMMRNTLVSPEELDNARQSEIRSIPLQVSDYGSIAISLLEWSTNGQPLNEPMVAAEHYLAITAQQVQDAFKKYIHPNHMVEGVVGPVPKRH